MQGFDILFELIHINDRVVVPEFVREDLKISRIDHLYFVLEFTPAAEPILEVQVLLERQDMWVNWS
jgi:hypothetical protein